MDLSQQMQQFSIAWLQAVAAAAGLGVAHVPVDDDSVDVTIRAGKGPFGRRPSLAVQLKATTQDLRKPNAIHFPLSIKNYNDLRAETLEPRILVVLQVPANPVDWLDQRPTDMLLQHCAWWHSLRGDLPISNSSTVTVQLPLANSLTPAALTAIFGRVDAGGNP